MSSANSPYAAPTSDLALDTFRKEGIYELPRFSACGVFFLTLVTFGLYYYYWMYRRTVIINRVCDRKISMHIPNLVIVYCIVSFIYGIYQNYIIYTSGRIPEPFLVEYIMQIIFLVLATFWLYNIRNRLNYMFKAKKKDMFWIGGILTFFGNAIYLQYKVNKFIDHTSQNLNQEFNEVSGVSTI
ncbi:DUF4234 domain-containing protein [Zooshikella sp. RANM57]|uniref:DUF4234 domain-containing protein n=1 Tax=Zooshikella sp. RANM57 TaxID=3425863 RepID=UPI003D6F8BEB